MNLILAILLLAVIIYSFKMMLDKGYNLIILSIIYSIHFSTFILNYKFNFESQFDSYEFYLRALNVDSYLVLLRPGTRFISFLIYPFVNLGIGYFILSLVFAIISLFGLLKITRLFFPLNSKIKMIGVCFMFVPSLHFWTSGLTKEALLIFFMALILEQLVKHKTLSKITLISLIIILFIRPYVFIFILIGLCFKFLIFENFSRKKLLNNLSSFLILGIISIPILKYFLNIKIYSIAEIDKLINKINIYSTTTGNSSLALADTNYLDRIIIVLFRPLFFDSNNLYQFVISLENFCFLLFIIFIIFYSIKTKVKIDSITLYLLVTSLLIILFLSIYMYNLGLASRMRVMFFPFLVLAMVLMFNPNNPSINEKKNN
ncbi:hypothetical protein V6251_08040 [Olleya sp. Ti.3.14]|uniref:hypothetical protein n=1 Tax=Olleya sp. Ti.3.14 TaxID=3121297 RepID=UPI00311DC29E